MTLTRATGRGGQPPDDDLTTISALSPADDDFMQRKAGAWTNRTINQVKADLGVSSSNTAPAAFLPADAGDISWAFDPVAAVANSLPTSGTLYLIRMQVRLDATATKFYWSIVTAGATPTSGQNYVGIYSSAGNLLVSAGVDADAAAGQAGTKVTTLTGTTLTAGWVWGAFLFNGTTTPALLRSTAQSNHMLNHALTASTYRFATNGSGRTALPATITPSSNASGSSFWCAVG